MVSLDGYITTKYLVYVKRNPSVSISVGSGHNCLLIQSKVTCWGKNTAGQLGINSIIAIGSNPTDMSNLTFISFSASLNAVGIIEMTAGNQNTCVLFANHSMICFGINNVGQSGAEVGIGISLGDDPSDMESLVPILFPSSFSPHYIVQITSGYFTTCALFSNGRASCWGLYAGYFLGRNTADLVGPGVMTTLDFLSFSDTIPMVMISSYLHLCGVFANSKIRCWSKNTYQQLGDGTVNDVTGSPTGRTLSESFYISFSSSINIIPILKVSVAL